MIAAAPLAATAVSSLFSSGPTSAATSSATSAASAVSATSPADSFAAMMASFSKSTVDKLQASEAMSISGIQGKATTQSVVEAVMSAQEQLQTALAVRDKAVAAFQDISRMPI